MYGLSEIRKLRLPKFSLLMALALITVIALSILVWKRNHTDALYEVLLAFDQPYSVETSYSSNTKAVKGRFRIANISKDKVSISYAGSSWIDNAEDVVQLVDKSVSDIRESARKQGIDSSVLSTTTTSRSVRHPSR